jgi:hypothetical protein
VQLLAVAEEMLEGEIAYRRGEHDAAFDRLRAAKRAIADSLSPPFWTANRDCEQQDDPCVD